jgi:hypothetical protein
VSTTTLWCVCFPVMHSRILTVFLFRVSVPGAVPAATPAVLTARRVLATAVRISSFRPFHSLMSRTGLVCTDAGITSGVLLAEYGFGDFGNFGGLQTAWDLSLVDAKLNLDTRLTSSDGKTVTCTAASCGADQAFNNPTDFQANRNSPIGITYTHTFCP